MAWLKSRRLREKKVQKHESKGERHEPGSNACLWKQIYRLCQTKEKSRQLGRAERQISKKTTVTVYQRRMRKSRWVRKI